MFHLLQSPLNIIHYSDFLSSFLFSVKTKNLLCSLFCVCLACRFTDTEQSVVEMGDGELRLYVHHPTTNLLHCCFSLRMHRLFQLADHAGCGQNGRSLSRSHLAVAYITQHLTNKNETGNSIWENNKILTVPVTCITCEQVSKPNDIFYSVT